MANFQERLGQLRGEFDKKRLETRAQRDAAKAPSEKVLATRASLDAKIAASRQADDAKRAARMAAAVAARKPPTAPPVPPPAAAPAPLAPPPKLSMPALGGAPAGGMGGAGGTQQMIKKGGMTYSMGGMTPPKKPVTLQTRQFGTGPGMRPTPKHIGKAITDRGKAILGKADGGMLKGSGRDGCAIRGKTRA